MATRNWQLRHCDKCRKFTKHRSADDGATVIKECLQCGNVVIIDRAAYAARNAKVHAARRAAIVENPGRRDD